MATAAIEILSDEEDLAAPPPTASAPPGHISRRRRLREESASSSSAGGGGGASTAIDLDDDDELVALPPPPPRVSSGRADEPVALEDDDPAERAAQRRKYEAAACKICEAAVLRMAYKLHGCGHSFCRMCIAEYVERKLRRHLASEVACPTCAKALAILDVQTLSADGKDTRPRTVHHADSIVLPPGLPPHVAAAFLQRHGGAAGGSRSGGGGGMDGMGGPPRATGSAAATKRLMREFQAIQKANTSQHGFDVELPDETDMYTWDATFFGFEKGTPLAKDLERSPGKRILLRIAFPSTYPAAPPYIRVIRPRFQFRTGHVTIGGSICTEMLTSAGWQPTMTIESALLSIRTNMLVGGARLDLSQRSDYSELEAREAFNRMVREHGWF